MLDYRQEMITNLIILYTVSSPGNFVHLYIHHVILTVCVYMQGGLVSMLSSAIKSGTHVREKIGKYIADSHHPVER